MSVIVTPFIFKTNQFNLTTKRFTETEVIKFQNNPSSYITLQTRVRDDLGDHGMISVVICTVEKESWNIDSFLMSCRVLGRNVEHAIMNELVTQAIDNDVKTITGKYIPTQKNNLVANLLENFGFYLLQKNEDGSTEWLLNTNEYKLFKTQFKKQR